MALSNIAEFAGNASACGASEPENKPAACGSACGAADENKEEKPSACGSACGASDKQSFYLVW